MGALFSNPEAKILIVGLDNAGKSTLVLRMKPDEFTKEKSDDIAATVGFQEESFVKNQINFSVFDMSG